MVDAISNVINHSATDIEPGSGKFSLEKTIVGRMTDQPRSLRGTDHVSKRFFGLPNVSVVRKLLPLEIQHMCLEYLDSHSLFQMTQTNKDVLRIVEGHSKSVKKIHAEKLMHLLEKEFFQRKRHFSDNPQKDKVLEAIRAHSYSLTYTQVNSIIDHIFSEDYQKDNVEMLGALVRGRPCDAEYIATKLDQTSVSLMNDVYGFSYRYESNVKLISDISTNVISSMNGAPHEAYIPFINRFYPEHSLCDIDIMSNFRRGFPYIPVSIRENICEKILDKESGDGEMTIEIYTLLQHLPSHSRDLVYQKATLIKDQIDSLEYRSFSPASSDRDHMFSNLPIDERERWESLFPPQH